MKRVKGGLGELEREVMHILWSRPALTAEDVRANLRRPLKEATVRTVLRRLEEKKYVTHQVQDRTFIYSPAEPRMQAAAKAVKRIVDWFCDGSVDEVLVGMVEAKMLDQAQLDKLATRVAAAKRQPKKAARSKKEE